MQAKGSKCLVQNAWIVRVITFFILLTPTLQQQRRPNIIFILVDDMGWNDIGYNGMTDIPTPNIDALAADGVILSSYYTPSICTPSRAALLTGKYPSRIGLQHHVILSYEARGMPLNVSTIADKLSDLGYINRLIGKWHLGFYKSEYLPTSRGFHSHFGSWGAKVDYYDHFDERSGETAVFLHVPENYTNSRITFRGHNLRCNLDIRRDLSGQFLNDILTERAVKHIASHDTTKPLFLLFSHHALHRGNFFKPMKAPERFSAGSENIEDEMRRNFSGFVKSVDDSVGQVISALFKKGILNDSVVIFASDNGADNNHISKTGGSNWPLRGQKFTSWEGGMRVPAFVWSPLLKNRKIWDGMMHVTDWFLTLYGIAGGNPKELSDRDGYDLWNHISENLPSPRKEILLCSNSKSDLYALRVGKYKIITGSYAGYDGWYGNQGRMPNVPSKEDSAVETVLKSFYKPQQFKHAPLRVNIQCGEETRSPEFECNIKEEVCLFNIEDDPCEYKNLARTHTDELNKLLNRLEELKKQDVPPAETNADYLANPSFYNDTWTPWADTAEKRSLPGIPCEESHSGSTTIPSCIMSVTLITLSVTLCRYTRAFCLSK